MPRGRRPTRVLGMTCVESPQRALDDGARSPREPYRLRSQVRPLFRRNRRSRAPVPCGRDPIRRTIMMWGTTPRRRSDGSTGTSKVQDECKAEVVALAPSSGHEQPFNDGGKPESRRRRTRSAERVVSGSREHADGPLMERPPEQLPPALAATGAIKAPNAAPRPVTRHPAASSDAVGFVFKTARSGVRRRPASRP
jgi:hypothetical protein